MSKAQLTESALYEWMSSLGVSLAGWGEGDSEETSRNGLRDGVAFCHLVNKIKPGSVENIKTRRDSGSAEDNTLRFLQACTSLGVSKIFKLADLTDRKREFAPVLATLRELYGIAEGLGMGLKLCLGRGADNDTDEKEAECEDEEEEEAPENRESQESPDQIVRAKYSFMGENEDELVFEKGDILTVTKVVEGGWWEGVCNGRVGWFPGNYVEEVPAEVLASLNPTPDKRSSLLEFYDTVINDIVESETAYTNDLQTLLSVYLTPLSNANILPSKDVEQLTGNLPEVLNWQQGFFSSILESSKLPFHHQNMGSVFVKAANELEALYTSYCANHPRAVAVLTDNSDILSSFMESHGAAAPGILALTTNLSKPFRRLEKYPALLKELQRNLGDDHTDAENLSNAVETYAAISARTQDIRKKKDAEYEMLTNPVQGFSGQSLAEELGECHCIIQANQALSTEDVEERFFLVFSGRLVVLAVGPSLSGYELKHNLPLSETVIKRGSHSESWPYPVEISHGKDTIHVSMFVDRDQNLLVDTSQLQQGGHVSRAPNRTSTSVTASKISMTSRSSMFRSAYPARLLRKTSAPIMRVHHWGFMSLRPAPPLKSQQLLSIRERDKSPKLSKKFIHPATKKRKSRALHDEPSSGPKLASVDQDKGDSAILKVIEAYCASGRSRALAPDRHSMPIRHSALAPASPTRHLQFLNPTPPPSQESPYSLADDEGAGWGPSSSPKLTLLSSTQRGKLGSFSSRAPSPGGYRSEKMSILRKRAESFDSHTGRMTRKPGFH